MSRLAVLLACLGVTLAIGATRLLIRAENGGGVETTAALSSRAERVCGAVEAGDLAAALAASLPVPERDGGAARQIVECRCWALRASERTDACSELLDARLPPRSDGGSGWDWMPPAPLVRDAIRWRMQAGRPADAAALAAAAADAHPESLHLAEALLESGMALHGERAGAEAFARRIAERERSATDHASRLVLALAWKRRGQPARALEVLAPPPPPAGHALHDAWLHNRLDAQAQLGDLAGARATIEAWRNDGAPEAELRARYAVALSMAGLRDPERDFLQLLREALADADRIRDPLIVTWLHQRLVAHLMADRRYAEALEAYDAGSADGELPGIRREEILREIALAGAARSGRSAGATRGRIRFRLPAGWRAEGARLLVSADAEAPPDADYEELPLRAAEGGGPAQAEITRSLSRWPVRWVLRDAAHAPVASGSAWPVAGGRLTVDVVPGAGAAARAARLPERRPGDGRRRVLVLVLDCADWRLVQYLRARGELPVHDALFQRGLRAVLASRPPLTAAAMEALVWPGPEPRASVLGWAHRMGLELGGLESVGENPLDFLQAVLPRRESLFETVGAGEQVAANMLFSHGSIDAGHHAELVGPRGRRSDLEVAHVTRALTPGEREALAALTSDPRYRRQVERIAGELDAGVELARGERVDLLMLRVEALDLLTHSLFSELNRGGQDDGRGALFDVYRYVDGRLAELHGALDADDVLVVMSDHGIRSAMEHEEDAIFVAVGQGVVPGRVAGRPALRGVPRLLADWLGVRTAWPAAGLAPPRTTQHAARR